MAKGELIVLLVAWTGFVFLAALWIGLRRGRKTEAAKAKVAAQEQRGPLLGHEWATKPCEMLIPRDDLEMIYNTEWRNSFSIHLKRANGIKLEFKDCQHRSAVFTQTVNAPANT